MTSNGIDMDSISLEQALIDFEVANARVIDLTSRLTSLSKDLLAVRGQAELERTRVVQLQQELAQASQTENRSQERAYILGQLAQSRSLRLMSFFAGRLRSALAQARAVSQ
jgi:hypothetical protein